MATEERFLCQKCYYEAVKNRNGALIAKTTVNIVSGVVLGVKSQQESKLKTGGS